MFLSNSLFKLNWARIFSLLDALDLIVTKSIHMDSLMLVEIGSSDIAVEGDSVIIRVVLGLNNIEAISNNIGVLHPPA